MADVKIRVHPSIQGVKSDLFSLPLGDSAGKLTALFPFLAGGTKENRDAIRFFSLSVPI